MNIYENDLPENTLTEENSLAIDTEATGLSFLRDRICVVQIATKNDEAHIVKISKNHFPKNLIRIMENDKIKKIFHFARFDVGMMYKQFGIETKNIYCTKIASKLSRTYSDKHGLKELCNTFLSIHLDKSQQTSDWANDNLTKQQLTYAMQDVIYLHSLMEKLNIILARENRLDIAQECFDTIMLIAKLDSMDFSKVFDHI